MGELGSEEGFRGEGRDDVEKIYDGVRKGLVVEQAEECRKVGGRSGFGVALLEGGLDALEYTGGLQRGQLAYGLQCGNRLSNWGRKKKGKKNKNNPAHLLLALQIWRPDLVQLLF